MFNVDFDTVVTWLLPKTLRQYVIVNYLNALLSPFKQLYNDFTKARDEHLYKLNHNSQVCYLESALNDTFDPELRRIYIADAGGNVITPLQRDSDATPVVIGSDTAGDALILQPDSGYTGGSYDFIVVLPYTFAQSTIYRLRSLVDYYKLAGKRYDIN